MGHPDRLRQWGDGRGDHRGGDCGGDCEQTFIGSGVAPESKPGGDDLERPIGGYGARGGLGCGVTHSGFLGSVVSTAERFMQAHEAYRD